jgi:folate-binding protein YgfZ
VSHGFSLGAGTVIRFQGNDRCRVLNNLCTQDLRKLNHGQSVETFVTDVKGRTFGHGIVFGLDKCVFFVSVPKQAERLVPHFDRYIIREDAVVSDQSDRYVFWIFEDRATVAIAFGLSSEQVPGVGTATPVELEGIECILVHAAWVGPESFLCLVKTGANDRVIKERLGSNWVASDLETHLGWEHLRIRASWPWYALDLDDKNLPQELDRDRFAISFNKGCYLGQETIARLDALGQVQKKLVQLSIATTSLPASQTPVYFEDKEVGMIRSAAIDTSSSPIGTVALAYIKRSCFNPGTKLLVDSAMAIVL